MNNWLIFRQRLKDNLATIHGEQFHYWGYFDDSFTGPMGRNETTGDSERCFYRKDKNGVHIFEGDIVRVRGHKRVGYYNTVVIFNGQGFYLKENHTYLINSSALLGVEVIGNIHKNPELLEEL